MPPTRRLALPYGISSEDGILQRNDDGTIKAVNSGSTTVGLPQGYLLTVPLAFRSMSLTLSKESLVVKNDPFSVTLADYELSKFNIYQRLVDNIEKHGHNQLPHILILLEDTAGEAYSDIVHRRRRQGK